MGKTISTSSINKARVCINCLSYNIIAQKVESPIEAHGYTIFENGSLTYFKAHEEPQKHHSLQVWQTPYSAEEQVVEASGDSLSVKVGNASIVRCIAECHAIYNLLQRDDAYEGLYLDLVKSCVSTIRQLFLDRSRRSLATWKETLTSAFVIQGKRQLLSSRRFSGSVSQHWGRRARCRRGLAAPLHGSSRCAAGGRAHLRGISR